MLRLQDLGVRVPTLLIAPWIARHAVELGTNGGGFHNASSARPFENPNGVTNHVQVFLRLVDPRSR